VSHLPLPQLRPLASDLTDRQAMEKSRMSGKGWRRGRRQTRTVIKRAVVDRDIRRAVKPALPAATPKVRIVKGYSRNER
jgi:hypothetical protein